MFGRGPYIYILFPLGLRQIWVLAFGGAILFAPPPRDLSSRDSEEMQFLMSNLVLWAEHFGTIGSCIFTSAIGHHVPCLTRWLADHPMPKFCLQLSW